MLHHLNLTSLHICNVTISIVKKKQPLKINTVHIEVEGGKHIKAAVI